MPKLKKGDQVRLKSGGPAMTVESVDARVGLIPQTVKCVWFGGRTLKSGYFAPETLVPVEETETKTVTVKAKEKK
jgi:uncharacterized protein YodC (DUF2158 family)